MYPDGISNTSHNGDRTPVFFQRALNFCYFELEQILKQISDTPPRFRKLLARKKSRLQREAAFIELKLREYK